MQPKRRAAPLVGIATLAVLALAAAQPQAAQAQFSITPTFDSTITSDPNAATIEATINSAISVYAADFTNPINVNIDFKEMSSGLGGSSTYYTTVSYTDYRNSLITTKAGSGDTAFLAYVPAGANNPVNGSSSVNVTTANARALGLSNYTPQFDCTISLNTSIINISRTGTQNGSHYDLQAVASHEIDESLGIGSSVGLTGSNVPIRGLDLYRYASPGVYSFTTNTSATPYLSVDGGNSAVLDQYGNPIYFNQTGGGADYNDWAGSSHPRVQDAFGTPGAQPNLGPGELTALQDLGYNLAVAPEPSAWATLALGSLFAMGLMLKAKKRSDA